MNYSTDWYEVELWIKLRKMFTKIQNKQIIFRLCMVGRNYLSGEYTYSSLLSGSRVRYEKYKELFKNFTKPFL